MKLLTILFLIGGSFSAYAQTPLLERKISVSLDQERLDLSLKKIAEAGGFTFSYNPVILDPGKLVTYTFINKTIREILDELFKGTVHYKTRGKYIILTQGQVSSVKKGTRHTYRVRGG